MNRYTPHGRAYGIGSAVQAFHPHVRCQPGTMQQCRPATSDEIAAKQAALLAFEQAQRTGGFGAQYMSTGDDRVSGDRFCDCVPSANANTATPTLVPDPSALPLVLVPSSTARPSSGGVSWLVVAAIGLGALGVGLALRR